MTESAEIAEVARVALDERVSRVFLSWHGRNGELWPCGHPKTPENTQSIGKAGTRCKLCRRIIAVRSRAKCNPRAGKEKRT